MTIIVIFYIITFNNSLKMNRNSNNNKHKSKRNTMPVSFNYNKPVCNNVDNNYCPNVGPNIFPTISDPNLCYPYMSYQNPFEPVSLPVYPPYTYRNPCPYNKPQNPYDQDFTSLPCVNNDSSSDDDSDKRRFSDPCIPNELNCDNLSSNGVSTDLLRNVVEQVNYLKEANRKLCRELTEVKGELSFVKQQLGSRFYEKDYEPGMLSDIVREIRDAARVREEALLSKVKHMIEEKQMSMNQIQMVSDKTRNSERIKRLEAQMKNLFTTNNSVREEGDTSNSTDQVLELEQLTLVLRRELQEAIAGKKDADAKIHQLDQMLTSLRQKFTNNEHPTVERKASSSSVENCSLLNKSRVVMSGPVTSL